MTQTKLEKIISTMDNCSEGLVTAGIVSLGLGVYSAGCDSQLGPFVAGGGALAFASTVDSDTRETLTLGELSYKVGISTMVGAICYGAGYTIGKFCQC